MRRRTKHNIETLAYGFALKSSSGRYFLQSLYIPVQEGTDVSCVDIEETCYSLLYRDHIRIACHIVVGKLIGFTRVALII